MSKKKTDDNAPQGSALVYAAVLFGILGTASMAMSFITSAGSIQTIAYTGPIKLDMVVVGNATGSSVTSGAWTASANETILAVASIGGGSAPAKVTSVTDTLGDVFAFKVQEIFGTGDLEIWQAETTAPGFNAVTVNWNVTFGDVFMVQAVSYIGSTGVAQPTGTSSLSASSLTLSLTSLHSGDWMFGAASKTSAVCSQMVTSPSFLKRSDFCSISGGTGGETEADDNATALPTSITITYTPSWSGGAVQSEAVMLELTAVDKEPSNFVPTTVCQNTADTCHINRVISGLLASNVQNAILNTAYCTGYTVSSLTTTVTSDIEFYGVYSSQDENISNGNLQVQLYLTTAAPSATWAAGQCSASQVTWGYQMTFFATMSASTATNAFVYSSTIIHVAKAQPAGTYYAYFEVTPRVASIKLAQWGTTTYSQLVIEELN